MAQIALITCGQFPMPALLTRHGPGAGVSDVDIYALSDTDLADFDALFIGTCADQRVLVEQRERLETFLQSGRTIVYCGHVAYPFLDGLTEFVPLGRYRLEDLRVARAHPHLLWDGIDPVELTFRKGVAGFYGRGHNPPPADAVILNVLGTACAPVDWMRSYEGGGVLLVHAGNELWGYSQDDGGAAELPDRLMHWIEQRRVGGGRQSNSRPCAEKALP